jgi:hypothetical protein
MWPLCARDWLIASVHLCCVCLIVLRRYNHVRRVLKELDIVFVFSSSERCVHAVLKPCVDPL